MKVLFLHGLESKPGGSKAKALKEAGFEVLNPALPREPFDMAVKIAQDVINYERPSVVVGSSRGGAVAMAINLMGAQRVLIAPAWRKYGVSKNLDPAFILHSALLGDTCTRTVLARPRAKSKKRRLDPANRMAGVIHPNKTRRLSLEFGGRKSSR